MLSCRCFESHIFPSTSNSELLPPCRLGWCLPCAKCCVRVRSPQPCHVAVLSTPNHRQLSALSGGPGAQLRGQAAVKPGREPICCPMSWPTQNTGAGCHGQHTGQLTKLPCIDALMTGGNANANAGECRQSGAAHLLTSCLGPRNGPQLAVGRDRGRVLSEHEVDGSGGSPAGRPGSRPQRFQPDGSFLERAVGCQVF